MISRVYNFQYRGFFFISILLMVFGYILQPGYDMLVGMGEILLSPSVLISDYMEIGGIGAAYFNSGLVLFITLIISYLFKAKISGALIAGFLTVAGFSFFGKNIINSLPLMFGVYLFTKFQGLDISNLMHIACFSTGISPAVSYIMFGLGTPYKISIPIAILVGIVIGFLIVPLSKSMLNFHKGYNLYNIGFTVGIIGLALAGSLRILDYQVNPVRLVYEGDDTIMFISMISFCILFLIYGIIINGGFKGYGKIIETSGRLATDYALENHKGLVIINMSLVGLISTLYVKFVGGVLNGPVIGGVFTVIAFGAFGKHPRNILPILIGVFLTSLISKYDKSGTEAVLIALFGTTIVPIAGQYGFLAGIIGGFIHKSISSNIGFVHGGMNLYNNGLAGGFTAGLLVPILDVFIKRRNVNEQRENKSQEN